MNSRAARLGRLPAILPVLATVALIGAISALGCALPVEAAASAVAKQAAFNPTARLEDDDPRAAFSGAWRLVATSSASGGTRRVATKPGATVRIRFRGTGAALVSRVSRTGGRFIVTVDGRPAETVELTRSATVERTRVWRVSGLRHQTHTVTVRAVETSPTATWQSPVVDRFEVEGAIQSAPASGRHTRIEESDRRIRFLGSWTSRARISSASRDRASTAGGSGAKAFVSFTGTGISWLAPNQSRGVRAQVLIDGRSYGYVSLKRTGPAGAQRVMWSVGGLQYGRHSLQVRAASSPSGGARVVVDVFDIVGTANDARPASSLGYDWKNYIVIDKSEFRLYLVKDGVVERTYPIAHGKLGWATPVRVWRVDAKYPHTGGVYGPRKMRLFKRTASGGRYRYVFSAYGIHGTNQPWVIGTRASHGCIRLYNDDVVDLFPRVPLGTMVVTRD